MFLIAILAVLISTITFLSFTILKIVKYADTSLHNSDKYQKYFLLLNQWMKLKQRNINISDHLLKKGYTKVAVYGMGAIGFRLCDELENSGVHVERTIDRAANTIYHPRNVWNPSDGFKDLDVDAVIVTVSTVDCDTVKSYMNHKEIPIFKIEDIIYSI